MREFGGDWTVKKKKVLQEYLKTYQLALKNQPFEKWYIDAFAGVGKLDLPKFDADSNLKLLDEKLLGLTCKDIQLRSQGSPLLSLQTDPPFDKYIFIEKSGAKCKALKNTIAPFIDKRNICIKQDDANVAIENICKEELFRKNNVRCVLFLDPFGMQVSWNTLKIVAETKKMDVWYLFPTSALKRMLPKSGTIPNAWKERIALVLGTEQWRERLYIENDSPYEQLDLFQSAQSQEQAKDPVSCEAIESYALERLGDVFPFVSSQALSLYNTKKCHLFSLVFAMSNDSDAAKRLGYKISSHIIRLNKEVL